MSTTTHHHTDSYDAQVDAVLKRIREENSFAAQMIRSILGPTQGRRSR